MIYKNRFAFSHYAWRKEEMDVLYWYYEESKSYLDVIGQLVKRFRDSNFKEKYRIDVILQLLQQVWDNSLYYSQCRTKTLDNNYEIAKITGYYQSNRI